MPVVTGLPRKDPRPPRAITIQPTTKLGARAVAQARHAAHGPFLPLLFLYPKSGVLGVPVFQTFHLLETTQQTRNTGFRLQEHMPVKVFLPSMAKLANTAFGNCT